MKKIMLIAGGVLLLFMVVLSLVIAPDVLSLMVVAVMLILMVVGAIVGILPVVSYRVGFSYARKNITRIVELQPNAPWMYVQQNEDFFRQKELDRMMQGYTARARREIQDGEIVSDIEEVYNEENMALRSWHSLVQMIPGTLTAIGLAGTFIGLIFGISSIAFSSVDSTIASIEVLLGGIRTAFYTSIIGILFSIVFNMIFRLTWQGMMREMGLFSEEFHLYILPSSEEQTRQKQNQDIKHVLMLLERLPEVPGFQISASSIKELSQDIQNEQQLLADIQEGLKNGEFIFYVQPRCDLQDPRKLVGGEALMRWNHKSMGMVSPLAFLPVMEKNGFIAKIDRNIWEAVCREIRKWLDEDKNPPPMSINISKTDVLTMDVVSIFSDLVRKYRIPPKYLELEISSNAYLQCGETMRGLENELRQNGFRVVVDGFTGDFSAMNLLKNAEVDAIKLDLRCIKYEEGARRETLSSIWDQAAALKIPLTVEGIENAEEMNILRRCGFREGQGYHLYRPMPMEEYRKLVEETQK